ncbi:hypothetical protein SETIT_4G177500v2 [Setaria italica]|uniref:Uncharacterized protein n=1 Tax=Setaria italica TaxID=4555 RepID=A0A368QX98_SETIT|nr:hypothetical protein SETIT_4G177500v2 [Setaria italica]
MECHATVAWRVWRPESASQPWRGFPWLGSKHVLSLVLRIKLREGTKLQLDTDAKFEKGRPAVDIPEASGDLLPGRQPEVQRSLRAPSSLDDSYNVATWFLLSKYNENCK